MVCIDLKSENVNQISGSLAPINTEIVSHSDEYIINEEFLKGKIQTDFFDETVNIDLGLNSIGENQVAINFDENYFQFAEMINKDVQNLKFDLKSETILLNISGKSNFRIKLNKKGELASPNSISITVNEKKL